MRKNLGSKPFLYPQPVLLIATYNEDHTANAMNAAWGSICDHHQIALYLSADHKTTKNILNTKAFTVSIADEDHVLEADYVGVVSGNKVPDKLARTHLTTVNSSFVNAPIIVELPLALEFKLVDFDEVSERVVGEIVNVSVDERVLDNQEMIVLDKLNAIGFDPLNHTYYTLGDVIGKAFHDGLTLK